MPEGYVEGSYAVSRDMAHAAYQVKTSQGVHMVRDGAAGPTYRHLMTRGFAPDSDRLFYWARGFAPHETYLVENDRRYPVGYSRREYLVFTPDGRHWALTAGAPVPADDWPVPDEARVLVMTDGIEQGRYPDATVPALSADGLWIAWPADGGRIRLIAADGRATKVWWDGTPFQRILLDAPCSATGVIRRHPDIKLTRKPEDIPALAQLQGELLDALWPTLAPGGILLYATCSVLPTENSETIAAFLARTPDAQEVAIGGDFGLQAAHGRQLLPQLDGHDGFYYAKLIKTAVTSHS